MDPVDIPPPDNVSLVPDKDTRKGMSDFTGTQADDRVLHINLWFFKYGTNDKVHAAALVLSLLLFLAVIGLVIFDLNSPVFEKVFDWLGSAFLFVSGVAIGKGGSEGHAKE